MDFWPTDKSNQEIIANKLNSLPKVVVSNTLSKAPWGSWPEATVMSGDAVEAIRKLKQEKGKDIVLWGSISLTQALMKADLIDEYHLQIIPTRLGEGRLLFPKEEKSKELTLTGNKVYEATGVMYLKYVPKRLVREQWDVAHMMTYVIAHAFLTKIDLSAIAPKPSILQSML